MTVTKRRARAQSSMEYLMTYGWAILILAIGVATLAALGIFNGGSGATNGCSTQPNFSCTNPIYSINGIIATISQNSGQYYYDSWVFVASAAQELAANGLPQNMSTANMVNIGELPSSQPDTFYFVSNTETTAGGIPTTNVPVGTQFTGSIWLAYCTVPGCSSPTGYAKVGTVSAKEQGTTAGFGGGTTILSTSSSTTSTTSTVTTTIHYIAITLTNTQPNPYVPITITNNNGASSPDFQQMLTITPSSFTTYETSDLGNIRFYQGSTELHSWCESGCTNTSSSATFWVLMPNGVPSGPSSINMTFLPVGTTYDDNYAGEAPQLSPSYAEYDNGASVFSFYDDFAGNSLNATKWDASISSGGSVSVDNGLTIVADGSDTTILSQAGEVATSTSLYVELLGEVQFNGPEQDLHLETPNGGSVGSSRDSSTFFTYTYCNGYTDGGSTTVNQNTLYLFSLYSNSTSSTTNIYTPNNYYVNYESPTTSSSVGVGTSCFGSIDAVDIQDGHTAIWIRTRAYPPNNVMPGATLGTLVTPQATPSTFQQMVNVSADYSSSGEDANLSNVEFTADEPATTAGNVPLYAWCESGCTASSTSKWWVKLTGSIEANSNAVIYMNFMPSNIMSGPTSYTGEAPQLSPIYAQYDNGAGVFQYYQKWGNLTSLPSGWSNLGSATTSESFHTTYTVFNSAPNAGGVAYTTAPVSLTSYPFIFELYGNMYQPSNVGGGNGYGVGPQANPSGSDNGVWLSVGIATTPPQMSWWGGQTNVVPSPAYYDVNSNKIYTITALSSTRVAAYENYALAFSSTIGAISGLSDISIVPNNPGPITVYWIRSRTYPPNGVMPTVSLSAVQ